MKPKLLAGLAAIPWLLSSCQQVWLLPACPMHDTYEYFLCTRPQLHGEDDYDDEAFQIMATFADASCTEEPGEWIPVLDRTVKESMPGVRDFIRKRIGAGTWGDQERLLLHELDLESYHNEALFPALLGIFVSVPVTFGEHAVNYDDSSFRQSCVNMFEDFRDGTLLLALQARLTGEGP